MTRVSTPSKSVFTVWLSCTHLAASTDMGDGLDRRKFRATLPYVLRLIGIAASMAGGPFVHAQVWLEGTANELPPAAAKVGAVTLGTNPGGSLVTSSTYPWGNLSAAWQSQRLESAIPPPLTNANTVYSSHSNLVAFGNVAAFAEIATTEDGVFLSDVTPVAEPRTCFAAALAAGFLIWQMRKSMLTCITPLWARHRAKLLAPLARLYSPTEEFSILANWGR